jgi:hypothetical protein
VTRDKELEVHFERKTLTDAEGRILITFIFKHSPDSNPNICAIATHRLQWLENKFDREPVFAKNTKSSWTTISHQTTCRKYLGWRKGSIHNCSVLTILFGRERG